MNPDFYSNPMPRNLNTIDDWIAILEVAREKVGGKVEVRLVDSSYVHDSDEYRVPDDVILRGSQSLLNPNLKNSEETYFVIAY